MEVEMHQQQALDVFINVCRNVERGHQSASTVIFQGLQPLSNVLLTLVRRHAQLMIISAINCADLRVQSSDKPAYAGLMAS